MSLAAARVQVARMAGKNSLKYFPGELPALYSGTNAEFTKADTVIFRYFSIKTRAD